MSDQPQTQNGPDLTGGIPANSLAEGVPLLGHVQAEPVILVRRGPEIFAIGATCSHYGGPLADGLVVDDTVRCPWHHACFSLRTGEALAAPALSPVAAYDIVQRAGQVFVTRKRAKPGSVRRGARPGTAAPRSVAIVGAGAAGNSAADELRHLGFEGGITLIDRDQEAPYDRPNLSKDYLAGSVQEEQLPLHPSAYYEERRVELVRGRQVTALDLDRKCLTFDDGTTREFGAIVLATGADPVRLAMPGKPGPPVYYLRTIADSRAIIKSAEGARRAVVLGASFIGLEVAASLRARKIEVHVVAPGRRPLERVLGPELGDFIRGLHEQHGVAFHLGGKASDLTRGGVVLEGGERLDADFIVAGIGVRPATALAEQAGLRVEKGIVVDAYLETATKGVFAVGDAARWPDARGGGLVRIEHWVLAQRQGQAVARTIVGERTPFTDVPFFWSQHYDISINYVGHAECWETIEIDGSLEQHDGSVRYRAGVGFLRWRASFATGRISRRSWRWNTRLEPFMVDEWKARPDRPVEVPLLHLQLSEQLERLRQEPTWRTSGRNAITLAKEPALRVVLMLLGKGAKISEHQAAAPLTFHVLTGLVTFRAGVRVESLGFGELIVLESTVAHEVEALEESACLLTLAGAAQD